jgi:glycosyltransferase involved in cell wall biosynthesis
MFDFKDLSIVIPAYNEEEGISIVVKNLAENLPDAEVIVVNDGSKDNTEINAVESAKKYANVKVYSHVFNRGYGAALKTGMSKSTKKYVAWFDSDNEHKVEDLIGMYKKIKEKNLASVISRRTNKSANIVRGVGKWLIRMLGRALHFNAGSDLNSGLRIFRRDIIINYLDLLPERYSASLTTTFLMIERGYPVEFYPITLSPRIGTSKVKLKDGLFAINKVLHLIMLFAPMRIFFQLGLITGAIGIGYSFYRAFTEGMGFPVAGTALLLIGLFFCILGLIADQISSIRLSNYKRSDSLIEKKYPQNNEPNNI